MPDELMFSAKYCYNLLKLHVGGNTVNRLGSTLFGSKIELTPHQIDAALFAFKSPFSKGVILADEVGLGKTIEAGIVITQFMFEKKNKVLVIAPASLQRQWENEISEKFALQTMVIDRKTYNRLKRLGHINPFDFPSKVLICSYQMCSLCAEEISKIGFNLVVIDEAHKLRNVYGNKSITAKNVLTATREAKKLLLTATPIQNSLMDLYGLSQFINPEIFADKSLFKNNYINNFVLNEAELEAKLHSFLHRTLRNQVNKYIKFTNRISKTFLFSQTAQETKVYESIRELLLNADNNVYIIPAKQRHLLLLILGKLMGSSMHAIVATLNKIIERLEKLQLSGFFEDIDDELLTEIEEDSENTDFFDNEEMVESAPIIDKFELNKEVVLLKSIAQNAKSVFVESKYIALQNALHYSFEHLREFGAEEKVVIFTESRRTQEYIVNSLRKDGYQGVLSFNGTNTDAESFKIYNEWAENADNSELLNRNKTNNIKTAILDKFCKDGNILVATEAGAEGLNLQFCSLVINYDLPWNPQRIEQRIGRCHRFGQKFDVVVINFISRDNVVEQRIFELLDSKLSLFSEVLGSSDTVLGTLENGEDLAQSIINIYTKCRSNEEINAAFDEIQNAYKDDILTNIQQTKQILLDNFDEDIQQYFSSVMDTVNESISDSERTFWKLTKSILYGEAVFNDECHSFVLRDNEQKYCFKRLTSGAGVEYGINSELGQKNLFRASRIDAEYGKVVFDMSNYPYKLSSVLPLVGKHGYMIIQKVSVQAIEVEEYLAINAIMDDGTRLDEDVCKKMFRLDTHEKKCDIIFNDITNELQADSEINMHRILEDSFISNNHYLQTEIDRINNWADEKIQATQLSVEGMREQRKLLQKNSAMASNFIEKKEIEEKIVSLSKKIKQSWISLADSEDEIEMERKRMINNLKKMGYGKMSNDLIFLIEFKVV